MHKTHLFLMVGHAGSGKSFFVKRLVDELKIVRLNGDSLRTELFGTEEEIQRQPLHIKQNGVFAALDYVTKQVLNAGKSVVLDANHNKRYIRQEKQKLAQESNAQLVVIWLKTPRDIAIKRAHSRKQTQDQIKWTKEVATQVIARHIANLDEPTDNERVITIDGQISSDEQIESFNKQFRRFDL